MMVWWVTGSSFALVGAVIAPTMVVAHFLDTRRRARRDDREKRSARARDDAARRHAAETQRVAEIIAAQRAHPSVTDIARCDDWVAPRDGRTQVRAGVTATGEPWLVDVADGVAVVGEGAVADAVWDTLCFHGTAHLGTPTREEGQVFWSTGARLVRGPSSQVDTTIRCVGAHIVSVGRRGALPERGDWQPDETSVTAMSLAQTRLPGEVTDRLVITLNSSTPHALFAGRTGSGKSHALVAAVNDWTKRFSPAEFTFIGIDFKGGATLRQLERFPHHRGTVTDLDNDVSRALHAITAEMRRREQTLRDLARSSIEETNGIPRLAIIVDEVHEFLRRHPDAHDVLGDIARRGRSLGVHLVLAVQHPTGVLRDSVLGNIPIRVCLAMNTPYDVMAVLGQPTTLTPSTDTALVTTGDGRIHEVGIPPLDTNTGVERRDVLGQRSLWRTALTSPVPREGRDGFGLMDDIPRARYSPALWSPSDGDVMVIGTAGSGRTAALLALTEGRSVTWVTRPADLVGVSGLVVIDDLDRVLDAMTSLESSDFLGAIGRARRHSVRLLVSMTAPIRGLASFRDTLTLRMASLEEHRATGAPAETFDPDAVPGVGTWRGLRVVLYARTDSRVTASIP
jgi:DNA segregation ATPase FtsK/SpoIIIE, S-DNA-T family